MKNQALFSSKDKIKKIKCRLLHFLFGALRVKMLRNLQPEHVLVPGSTATNIMFYCVLRLRDMFKLKSC